MQGAGHGLALLQSALPAPGGLRAKGRLPCGVWQLGAGGSGAASEQTPKAEAWLQLGWLHSGKAVNADVPSPCVARLQTAHTPHRSTDPAAGAEASFRGRARAPCMAALCRLRGGVGHKQLCRTWHAVMPDNQGACIGQERSFRAPHEAPLAPQVHPLHLQQDLA